MPTDSVTRYPVPPDEAEKVMVAAGAIVRALTAIDAVIADGEAAREDSAARERFPPRPAPEVALLEARAIRAATLDQARGVQRTDPEPSGGASGIES
jgi:hypothetical protein